MWGREVGVDEEEGIWMTHKGGNRETYTPEEGSPFSDGAHGQPAGGAGTGDMGLEEYHCRYSRRLYSREWKGGVRGAVYVLEGEAANRAEM